MPSLDQQAQKAKKVIDNGLRGYTNYAHWPFHAERDILVLWGIHRGWGIRAISKHIGCSTTTVWKVRDRFYKDPSEIFLNPVLSGILRAGKFVWKCEFHGLPLSGNTEHQAHIHAACHFLIPLAK